MADTRRTWSALATLLADNTAGAISAQDLRDFLASVQPNADASNDPTISNDETEGYSIGGWWLNQATSALFVCLDPSTGAAVWKRIYRPRSARVNAQVGTSYTLAASDMDGIVTLSNASAITLTVPPNSSVAIDVGASIRLAQLGAGTVTVSPGSGVTAMSLAGATDLSGQGAAALLTKIAPDSWLLEGDLA